MHSPNNSWREYKLSELGVFARGKSRHRPRDDKRLFEKGKYPLVQTGEIKNAMLYVNHHTLKYGDFGLAQSKLWDKGTLCITIAANIAETAILTYPMCFPDSIVGFIADKNKCSELFMHYIFTYIRKSIQNSASGSIQDNINIEYLTNLKFKIPQKDYQDKIVMILSALDDKIELNNKINSELETMARNLYSYWFVQFDFPDETGRPYKSAGGEMVFNTILNREIPKGWEVKKLKELVKINKRKAEPNADLRLIDLSIMPSSTMCLNQFSAGDSFATNMFDMRKYDILFGSIRPYLLKAGFTPFDGLVAGTIHSFSPLDASNTNFLLLAMTSKSIFDHAITSSKGTKMPVIGASDLLDYLVPYSSEVMATFEKAISFKEIIAMNIEESARLATLRDFLLPMLMNGQVSVAS